MADVSKTVAIVFQGDTSDAETKINSLSSSIDKIGSSETIKNNLGGTEKAIAAVGTAAKTSEPEAQRLAAGLRKLAEDAGAPKEALQGIDSIIARIGVGATGSAVVAAASIAAFAAVMVTAGAEATKFKTEVKNLNDESVDAEKAFNFVKTAVNNLETDLTTTLNLYSGFLREMQGTEIPAQTAEDAFLGITKAVKGQDGDIEKAGKALKAFVDIADDGEIDLKDLNDKIRDIPGGLKILEEALGVPKADLETLAKNGKLGKEEIEKFAKALRQEDYGSITPVKDAFNDLWNTIKSLAVDVGAEGFANAAFYALEKAIRAVTLSAVGAVNFGSLLGKTLANVAFSIANLDFAGFQGRQSELLGEFSTNVESARSKFLGTADQSAPKNKQAPDDYYKNLAESLRATGDEAEKTAKKTKGLADENSKAEKTAIALAKAAAEEEKAIAKQAEQTRKAEESVRNYKLELEKLASNERIKFIEAKVKLDIAEAEANAKIIAAAFESVAQTVTSTGQVLGSIFGVFKEADKLEASTRNKLFDNLDKENKRRDEAFKLQKELTRATIDQMRAQTESLQRGDAIIKIDGAGLQPHLEAFMWEILRTIQVRVNADGLKMLLGV